MRCFAAKWPISKAFEHSMKIIPRDIIIETDRLYLRSVDLTDVDLVWDVSRVDGFNDGMTWDPPSSKEDIVSITNKNIADWESGTDYVFTVVVAGGGESIGRVGIHQKDTSGVWNIGFWICPEYWSCGYATEASIAILNFGFQQLNAKKITTDHAVWNQQSRKVIAKLGFTLMGENPKGFVKNGDPVAVLEYELTSQF